MGIEKLPTETEFDYHRRLILGKLVDKTLADYDYSEISKYIYGKEYSSDVARRMLYGSRYTLDLLDRQGYDAVTDDAIIAEIDDKLIELQKERQRFYDQRREYNKIINAEGREEHLHEMLIDAANHLDESVGRLFDDEPSFDLDVSDNQAVLVFSDWHYGMVADNAFNHYNTDVCRRRVHHVVEEARKRLLLHKCSILNIVVLGDLLHGAVHTSARVASEELVADQLMQSAEILAQAIVALSKYVNVTIVRMTYGNHARTVPNKKDNIHRDNMERIIPWWLEQRFYGNSNILIDNNFENEFMVFDVNGHSICASHGDLDSVKSSPRLLTTLFHKKYGVDIECILLGDKHHRESFDELGVTAMICGSLCGTDDYANGKRLFSTPSQLMLIVDKEHGIDAEYNIRCG